MSTDDPRHGTNYGYVKGCRSDCCREPHRAYLARYRVRRYLNRGPLLIPTLGTRRRVEALMALGWSRPEIAKRGGWAGRSSLESIISSDLVTASSAARIAQLYDQMCMQTPPASHGASQVRNLAASRGWPPPLAWDDIDTDAAPTLTGPEVDLDEAVVERVLSGRVMPTTPAERVEIVRRWRGSGRPLTELERLTGWQAWRYYDKEDVA